jgi:hypothetical protein
MKLTFIKNINLHLLIALSVTGLLATAMIGCGDDDDDKGTPDASMAGSGKGGKGGIGGGTAGTGGSGGTGGTKYVPTDPEDCKVSIKRDSPQDSDARTNCLCDKCFDVWIDCLMDEGCQKLVRCSTDNGCIEQICAVRTCYSLMSEYPESLMLSNLVADCNRSVRCDLANETDGGIADSGAEDSGF